MNIPEQYKKAWLALATAAMIVAIILGITLICRADDDKNMPATITINGKGEVQATPDISKFMVTIEETAKDQKTALTNSSTKVNAIIDGLKAIGIAEKDIKTEYTSMNPKYEMQRVAMEIYPPVYGGNQVVTGYTSSHTLSVKVRDLEKVSGVQQLFASSKVQNVSGPELTIDNPEELKLDARAKAIDDAQDQARTLARQLHVRLGDVVSFNESGDGAYPVYMSARANVAMDAGAKSAPEAAIATGEQTITSNVSVTYKIR